MAPVPGGVARAVIVSSWLNFSMLCGCKFIHFWHVYGRKSVFSRDKKVQSSIITFQSIVTSEIKFDFAASFMAVLYEMFDVCDGWMFDSCEMC